jgi:hypothetical protein
MKAMEPLDCAAGRDAGRRAFEETKSLFRPSDEEGRELHRRFTHWMPIANAPRNSEVWASVDKVTIKRVSWHTAKQLAARFGGDEEDYDAAWIPAVVSTRDEEDYADFRPQYFLPLKAIPTS